jgi:hypothetical protein
MTLFVFLVDPMHIPPPPPAHTVIAIQALIYQTILIVVVVIQTVYRHASHAGQVLIVLIMWKCNVHPIACPQPFQRKEKIALAIRPSTTAR